MRDTMFKGVLELIIVLVLCLTTFQTVIAQKYEMIDLGTLGGGYGFATDINNFGQVVGLSDTATTPIPPQHPFLWTRDGGMVDLGTLGGTYAAAKGINDLGEVVGWSYTGEYIEDHPIVHAFLWTKEKGMVDLGTMEGFDTSDAAGINNIGQIVGTVYNYLSEDGHACVWSKDGQVVDIGKFGIYSVGRAINNLGQIVGRGATTPTVEHMYGFLWTAERGMVILENAPGTTASIAQDVNELGDIVGIGSETPYNPPHAVLWTKDGEIIDLGFGATWHINNHGQIVGKGMQGGAFLWDRNNGMRALNNLIPKNSGLYLDTAQSINDAGQIVGEGLIGTETHAFLLTPIKSIAIDIKPGSYPNSINPKSNGKIPVAILSAKDFNAVSQIDLNSLTFGRTGDEPSLAFCHGREDVNKDGLQDMVCHFYTQDTGFQCGDTEGILKGKIKDGTAIEGIDLVKISPCR